MNIAAAISAIRKLLPTSLGSSEVRDAIAEDVRARSVFVSRGTNAIFLAKVQEVTTQIADGELDYASGRLALLETLRELGYTPEGGFPDDLPGTVPPAVAGSLQDLKSTRRLNLIIETQVELVRGRGQQLRGMNPETLAAKPAWELVRFFPVEVPRDWPARWEIAGGTLVDGGRMIALKGDPLWGELGSSANFEDALDVDFPPFAFNSGMRWRPISRSEADSLGITGPDGETADEWVQKDHPTLVDTQSGIPDPQVSLRKVGEGIRKKMAQSSDVALVDDIATTQAGADALRARIAAREKAREERRQRRLDSAIERLENS